MASRDPKTGRFSATPDTLVFVYGSLKAGYSNHYVLGTNHKALGEAVTTECFRMISLGFPVVQLDGDGHQIRGELYRVDRQTLAALDRLEGVGRMYDRYTTSVTLRSGGPIEAIMYVAAANGRWGRHFQEMGHVQPDEHGELVWRGDVWEDEPEVAEPEDQTQGDVEGYYNEREQP